LEKFQQKPKRDHSAPKRIENERRNTDLIITRRRDDSAPRNGKACCYMKGWEKFIILRNGHLNI
jgi:hypothetical protein